MTTMIVDLYPNQAIKFRAFLRRNRIPFEILSDDGLEVFSVQIIAPQMRIACNAFLIYLEGEEE